MVTTNGLIAENPSKIKKKYKTGHCSRCNSINLVVKEDMVICNNCNNWTWLDDAIDSCWNGYVSS